MVPAEQLTALNITRVSLCYEIHGQSDQWFNLVTDECATVNAQYFSLSRRLNIIDEIGVRAVDDNNRCVNIRVNVGGCTAEVNGVSLDLMERFSQNGISVRRYNNRVRISVPNCNELTLVMWAICEIRTVDNPDVPGERLNSRMIKYVVMRGLNFGHRVAHGLLGKLRKERGGREGGRGREGREGREGGRGAEGRGGREGSRGERREGFGGREGGREGRGGEGTWSKQPITITCCFAG